MKHLSIVLIACLPLLSPTKVAAQSLPEECPDTGLQGNYVVFTMTVQLSLLEYICGEIAPDTRPSFDRVLGRYRDEAPACFAATRKIAELKDLPKSSEAVALISDYRSGVMQKEKRDAILHSCRTIELSDKRGRDEREAFRKLLQAVPGTSDGG